MRAKDTRERFPFEMAVRLMVIAAAALFLAVGPARAQAGSPCDSEKVVPAGQDDLREDCKTLWAFYSRLEDPGQLDDPGPGQWGPNTDISSWRGVITGLEPRRVIYLNLGGMELTGPIPSELGQLTELTHLYLGGNRLTGSIPPELGRLTELTELLLGVNRLTGPIPSELGRLTKLTRLYLHGNQLTGTIPPELGQLTELTSLFLDVNRLTGTIPPELGQLTELVDLRLLVGNRFEGQWPSGLSRLNPFREDPLGLTTHIKAYQEVTLGNEIWDVWLCDTPAGQFVLNSDTTIELLNREIPPYFHWLSNNRYKPSFRYINTIKISGNGPLECDKAVRARRQTEPSDNRFIVFNDAVTLAHSPGTGPKDHSVTTGADAVADVREVQAPYLGIIAHEIGHSLGFPHSYGGKIYYTNGPVFQYDNIMDIMSGQLTVALEAGTVAANRYYAGWIDLANVAVHPVGKTHTYELRSTGVGGTQMIVLTDPLIGRATILGARVAKGYDSAIPEEGVEVYRIEEGLDLDVGLRRIQPFPPASPDADFTRSADLTRHVHSVGDMFEVGTATIEIVERTGDDFTVRVTDSAQPRFAGRFSDDDASTHQANIEAIAARGVTVGCSPTYPDRFCPGRKITRAQMMAFLARALGQEVDDDATTRRFADVPAGAWYMPYLARLAELGVVEPYEDGTFRPSAPLTRSDMALFLVRAFPHLTAVSQPVGAFADVPATAPYAAEVEAILAAGVTRGCSAEPARYCPDETVTRAQMASFLIRALQGAAQTE